MSNIKVRFPYELIVKNYPNPTVDLALPSKVNYIKIINF